MKKTFAKILAAVLAMMMISFAFAGCGAEKNDNTIIIGGIGPLTGTASTYGISVKNAAQIAVDEINAAGGIGENGIKLSLFFEDDEADGAKSKSAYETLMDKGMQILVGAVTSGASVALNDSIKKDGILQVTPSASQIEAVSENPNAFRICFTDPMQGEAMADYASKTLGYTKAAVIHNQDDSYSTGMYEAFKAKWADLGLTLSADVSFTKDATDFSAQITKIAASDAEYIFLPIYAEKAAAIVIAANEKNLTLPMVGGDGLDGILNYLQGDNAKLVEGLIYLTPFVATDSNERIQNFVKVYKEKYGTVPDQFAADGYDAVYTIKAAIEEAGITDASKLDNAALVAAMTKIKIDGLTGEMTFGTDGEPTKGVKVAKIINGEYVAQ